jgi:two-component system chemotaxis sensor kinase CheA
MAAVGVDRLAGMGTVMLRPLPRLAPADAVVAGASFDREGNPRLVLDPSALIASVVRRASAATELPEAVAPVLIVDDSLTTRMLEQSILESAGYDVDLATSGEDGLEKARARRYSLFLVDVEMPGMDGFTFVERIRSDPSLRETPAILVTSRGAPEDRTRGIDVGANAFIVKSVCDLADLLARIRCLRRVP